MTLAVTGLVAATPALAADDAVRHPVRSCAQLPGDHALPGAATHVTQATVVAATKNQPEHCDVRGYIEPAVRFVLKLPTKTYAGRYLQYGCGGFCGVLADPPVVGCGPPHGGDMAVAATDDGHVGKGEGPEAVTDGTWGAHDQAARDDFAFRAPHVVSRAAKHLIGLFYGAPPHRSYFTGCSDGGREALLLAQRYPTDFDGIVAGAPAADWDPLIGVFQTWLARANTGADGKPILTTAKLPPLHAAALAGCDRADGLADGQIDEPRECRFDPAVLRCPGADRPDCLTPAQVEAVKKIYAAPSDSHGRLLYPGGEPVGSELAWANWITPSVPGGPSAATAFADNYLKYLAYPIGEPTSSVDRFAFTTEEFDRLTAEGLRANAMNLDLRAFHRAGGKLILWHGWADQAIPPTGTLDYYQRLWERSGGPGRTQEWARLFMVPSLYHCAGGSGLTEFDPLRALTGWVEHGTAPSSVVATGKDQGGTVLRTRPVYPYPLRAKYTGTGSSDDAANFRPVPPVTPPHDVVDWAGNGLYAIPGPVAR
ncbi:tannase/feruloyl esterase family alpha/beta hydrolase [Amycolatopsis samaneae]|uniref:Tannase/feruloyl esterase family alpha/beta hydrolase n=1 Tax=Amycolatopsis samaneae TaxID=664691 RepID=A0ABW5GPV4_9PSEU